MSIKIEFDYFDIETNKNTKVTVNAEEGDDILHLAHDNGIPLEGACGGSLACSTCHIIMPKEHYNEDDIEDEEDALLDAAFGREEHSRLGCQVCIEPKHNEMTVKIPKDNKNFS